MPLPVRPAATVTALAAVTLLAAAAPAAASGTEYGAWDLPGRRLTVPAAGFPAASVTTDSTNPTTPSGSSSFLNRATPFGAAFGSSQGLPYLSLRAASGNSPSTTTLAFETAPPAGSWGFALGDVDADTVTVSGTAADGSALTAADLGFRGAFTYCTGSPLPSGCGGPQTDLPRWDAATATLVGSGADTSGAAGWFRPAKAVRSLTLTFTVQTGIPLYQLWVAADTTAVAGRVGATGCAAPDRTTLALLAADGTPVTGPDGRPVTTTTAPDGSYAFTGLAAGAHRVRVEPPPGYTARTATRDTPAGADATGVDFALTCRPVQLPPRKAPARTGEEQPVLVELPAELCGGTHLTITRPPQHGTARIVDNCRVRYTPEPDYTGPDAFSYSGHTTAGLPVTGTERLSVTARPKLAESGRPTGPLLAASAGCLVLGAAARWLSGRLRRRAV
ncbi:Ig-like domain-containing protein [Kitasatospora sp. NPDC096147]|uniref:Ig-like domain-containing protein n=1 Tax=Kitasatospora sp. NPDC096147 TaxID=3364093 RepID=UPI0038018559